MDYLLLFNIKKINNEIKNYLLLFNIKKLNNEINKIYKHKTIV
jgi:hypothetical protein